VGDGGLPAWPKSGHACDYEGCSKCEDYQRACADAAMARLRLAVEALRDIANAADKNGQGSCEPSNSGHGCYSPEWAQEALASIGPLPPLPEESP
jgi:hypothetical protein